MGTRLSSRLVHPPRAAKVSGNSILRIRLLLNASFPIISTLRTRFFLRGRELICVNLFHITKAAD